MYLLRWSKASVSQNPDGGGGSAGGVVCGVVYGAEGLEAFGLVE